jgi:hypothetical protein
MVVERLGTASAVFGAAAVILLGEGGIQMHHERVGIGAQFRRRGIPTLFPANLGHHPTETLSAKRREPTGTSVEEDPNTEITTAVGCRLR